MSAQHIPEPWVIEEDEYGDISVFGSENAQCVVVDGNYSEVSRANWERIVACVNACAGLTDADLGHAADAGGWKAISAQWIQNLANANEHSELLRRELDNWIEKTSERIAAAEKQRDELLEVLDHIIAADKTVYDYHGKHAENATGNKPKAGIRWATPSELAQQAKAGVR